MAALEAGAMDHSERPIGASRARDREATPPRTKRPARLVVARSVWPGRSHQRLQAEGAQVLLGALGVQVVILSPREVEHT